MAEYSYSSPSQNITKLTRKILVGMYARIASPNLERRIEDRSCLLGT